MDRLHSYEVTVEWTGDLGSGTSGYRAFSRDHVASVEGKASIAGSADPAVRGDPSRWTPEELLVVSLSQCHMLWYLHLCSAAGVRVVGYVDRPRGVMEMDERGGGGAFTEVVLRPEVTVAEAGMVAKAERLHADVPALCFIARSVNFPVRHEPVIRVHS